jgi:hypothetical protein
MLIIYIIAAFFVAVGAILCLINPLTVYPMFIIGGMLASAIIVRRITNLRPERVKIER